MNVANEGNGGLPQLTTIAASKHIPIVVAFDAVVVRYDENGQPLSLIDIRPMDLADILDGTIRVYRRNPWVFIVILAVIVGVPIFITQFANYYIEEAINQARTHLLQGTPEGAAEALRAFRARETVTAAAVIGAVNFIMFFLAPLAQAAMVHAVTETILGREVGFVESLRAIREKIGTVVIAYVVYVLIMFAFFSPFLLFVVMEPLNPQKVGLGVALFLLFPVCFFFLFYFIVKFLFITQAIVLEDVGAVDALRRSFRLASGFWWRTFGIYMIISILVAIVVSLLNLFVYVVDWGLGLLPVVTEYLSLAIGSFIKTVISLVINPITWIATTLMYFDLRIRKEGFDLVLLAASLGGGEGESRDPWEGAPVG